jgi:hypothetical protein
MQRTEIPELDVRNVEGLDCRCVTKRQKHVTTQECGTNNQTQKYKNNTKQRQMETERRHTQSEVIKL